MDQNIKRNVPKQIPPTTKNVRSGGLSSLAPRSVREVSTQPEGPPDDHEAPYLAYSRKELNDQRPSRLPTQSSPQLRGAIDHGASSPQIRSTKHALAGHTQNSKASIVSYEFEETRNHAPHPLYPSSTRMRNDDSMTYVAITASGSSPQSEIEDHDDRSEGSHYTDREAFDDDANAPAWARAKKSFDPPHMIQRHDALIVGLGLGSAVGNADQPNAKSGYDQRAKKGHNGFERSSPSTPKHIMEDGYLVMEEGCSPVANDRRHIERPPAELSSKRPPSTGSRAAIKATSNHSSGFHSPNPEISPLKSTVLVPQTSRQAGWNPGGESSQCDNRGDATAGREATQSPRRDARRNTWVYDEVKPEALVPTQEERAEERPKPDRERENSAIIPWSDSGSPEERLSEDAQRMFDQLQQGNGDRETTGIHIVDEHYHDPADYTPRLQDQGPRVSQDQEQESLQIKQGEIIDAKTGGVKTWRRTISSSAYQSLLKRHGIIEMKRQDVIFELCETEAAFVKSMKMVVRIFVEPLRSRGYWLQGLPSDSAALFETMDGIINVHTQIASALHSLRASQFPLILNFAETFRPFVYRLEAHQPYLVHLEQVTKQLDEIVQDPESKLGQFIRSQNMSYECENMGFTSFLLKPMQRLTKYPLFFKQIWELTPRSHPDHLPMFSLYHSTSLVIKVMQEVKAREEEFKYIESLAARVAGIPPAFELARRERRLVAQGLLRKVELPESIKEFVDGFSTSMDPSHELSPRPSGQRSPLPSATPGTPPIPELAKLGPVTSPLFPLYHNRTPVMATPPSPYTPRQTYMSAVSRASTVLSEASRISEWTTSYSPTTSMAIPSDFEDGARPDSSASSILSNGHAPFVPYGQMDYAGGSKKHNGPISLKGSGRGKAHRETPIYVFVFNDLVIFTSQTEKSGLFTSKNTHSTSERLKLIENWGISRVLGVIDRSGKLDYNHLIQVDLLPMSLQDFGDKPSIRTDQVSKIFTLHLTLPTTGNARLNLQPTEQMDEAKNKWLAAFDRCYGYTLRALTFPSVAPKSSENSQEIRGSSVMDLLTSGTPLPKSPSYQGDLPESEQWDPSQREDRDSERWSRKFKVVLREIERTQDTPVMLIGDAALTIGRGLKRVHTTDRTRRNGPQQLLLPAATGMSSPSASSGSSQGRRSILGIKRK